ncbi:hypothetical protein H4S07_003644, partial [Coemansia furcata]
NSEPSLNPSHAPGWQRAAGVGARQTPGRKAGMRVEIAARSTGAQEFGNSGDLELPSLHGQCSLTLKPVPVPLHGFALHA